MGDTAIQLVDEGRRTPVTVDAQGLLEKAVEKGLPIEQMERLLVMRRELRAEWARDQFFCALSLFQRDCPVIAKDKEVYMDGKKRYSYAPLDQIVAQVKEALQSHGFSYVIKTSQTEKAVTSICIVHHVDGHQEETQFTIPMDPKAYMNESQRVASAMTYSKRYAFCNAFGIMTGDSDDDSGATGDPGDAEGFAGSTGNGDDVPRKVYRWTECGKAPQSYWQATDQQSKSAALVEEFGPGEYKVEKGPRGWTTMRRMGVDAEAGQSEIWTPDSEDKPVTPAPADLPMATPTGKPAHTLGDRLTTIILSPLITEAERYQVRTEYKQQKESQRSKYLDGWERDLAERAAAKVDPGKVTLTDGTQVEIPFGDGPPRYDMQTGERK